MNFLTAKAFFFKPGVFYRLRQTEGAKINSIGNTSSRPISMAKLSSSLEKSEKAEKFPVGPTIPSPGPILFRQAAIAVKFVSKSKPSTAISRTVTSAIAL